MADCSCVLQWMDNTPQVLLSCGQLRDLPARKPLGGGVSLRLACVDSWHADELLFYHPFLSRRPESGPRTARCSDGQTALLAYHSCPSFRRTEYAGILRLSCLDPLNEEKLYLQVIVIGSTM